MTATETYAIPRVYQDQRHGRWSAGNWRTETRMALIEDMFKGNALTGVAVGAAALFLGPTILPTIGRALRPVAKTMIKGGIGLYRTIVTAVLAGVAGGLMAPLILPRLERNLRPATKSLFKTGISLYERGRERGAEMGKFASDMMAEARAEYDAEQSVGVAEDNPVTANEVVRLRNGHARE